MYPGILYAKPYTRSPLTPFLRRVLFRTLRTPQVLAMLASIEELDFLDQNVHKISLPTLLLWGEKDGFLSHETPVFLNRIIPNITSLLVHNCAHILCLEAPINVYNHMMDFFQLGQPLHEDPMTSSSAEAKVRKVVSKMFPIHPETLLGKNNGSGIDVFTQDQKHPQ